MQILKTLGAVILSATMLHTEAASVWKVTFENNTLYIGGTIHVLSEQDYPLPKAYDIAFQNSETIVFETDIEALKSPDFTKKFMAAITMDDGKTIDQLISKDIYNTFVDYLNTRKVPIITLHKVKLGALSLILSTIELPHLGYTAQGVDDYYFQQATLENKTRTWLEQPEEQIAMMANLNGDDQTLLYALEEIATLADKMKNLRKNWREGDMKAMEEHELTPFRTESPEAYQSLIIDRNENWMPKIEKMFKDEGIEFVMVGAMHLTGPDSVLLKLENNGYTVEQM